ncbi:urease accessory protein UreF [Phytomonospora sp. NPDC050363]|uniref:urease accessory protein UreF n=1 Tax=Phytomonospora sp. NPDC050363 TaxID=3155642 RepID=UPI0033DF04E0
MADAGDTVGGLLRALQFGDSVFPVGGFSFSNGIETAIEEKVVHDPASLREWVRSGTRLASRCDAIALLHAHRATRRGDLDAVRDADEAVYLRKLNEETRTMTVRMGRKLAEAAARIVPSPATGAWLDAVTSDRTPGSYPVGLGVLFAELGRPEGEAFAVHQYGTAATMISAAVRLMRLHYLDAQAILFAVNAEAQSDYATAAGRDLADMSGFAPQLDVLAAVHVRAHVRMFMN